MERLNSFIHVNKIANAGLILLTAKKALEALKICEEEHLKLGGFDGFYVRADGVQIEQNLSKDYSNQSKQKALELAAVFFEDHEGLDDVGYELVVLVD